MKQDLDRQIDALEQTGVPRLLARPALDQSERGAGLGGWLLVDALRRCVRGGREFGARAVVVDAIGEGAALSTGTSNFISSTNGG
ncbi:MAG: hypothetical protein ACR2IP_09485 [Solirubrobacteraceae bacterium]